MDRYPLTYLYRTADSQTWTDITSIVDSASTTITQHLCSTSFKSVVDEASFRIPPKDTEMKQTLINALFGDKDIFVQILTGETVRFYGVINRDNISVTSTRLTADVTISCEDISVLHLDDKVKVHVFQENKTITQLVWHLLGLAGYTYDTTKTIRVDEERTLTAFVIDADSSDTFRTYIDDLLFEAGGYVLNFRESGIAEIVRIPWDDSALVKRALGDNKISARGLSTRSSNLTEDGVKLKWSTVATTEPGQTVYLDSINRSVDEEGSLVGEDIVSGGYWPQDGDIVATYQEYSADFLDKPYLIKDSRLQNKDLSIIAVKDISAYIQATNPDGSKFESWTYPVLPSLGMTGNPEIWPTKAWYLLRNDSADTVNIQFFTLRGTVTYRSRINEMLLPAASDNPKEYTSKYIYDEDHAELFSTFYWHFMSNARFVSTWSEVGGGSLGETVRVQHKGNDYLQDVVVVSKETSWVGHTEINDLTGVAVSAYNAYTMSQSSTLTGSKPTSQPGEKGDPGATFTPSVDASGNLSWTNNAGLPNPPTMNIKGPEGPEGPAGSSGRYRGVINANPATAKEGDYYVFGLCGEELERDDEGTIYEYKNGEWVQMEMVAENNDRILVAYSDIIEKKDDTAYFSNPPTASGTIQYAKTIFANDIMVNSIFAKNILMNSRGSIESSNYEENNTIPVSGFKLTSEDGVIRSVNGIFSGMRATGANIEGNFSHPYFNTVNVDDVEPISTQPTIEYYNEAEHWNTLGPLTKAATGYNFLYLFPDSRTKQYIQYGVDLTNLGVELGRSVNMYLTARYESAGLHGLKNVYYFDGKGVSIINEDSNTPYLIYLPYDTTKWEGNPSFLFGYLRKDTQSFQIDLDCGSLTTSKIVRYSTDGLTTYYNLRDSWDKFKNIGQGSYEVMGGTVTYNGITENINQITISNVATVTTVTGKVIMVSNSSNDYYKADNTSKGYVTNLEYRIDVNGIKVLNITPSSDTSTIGLLNKPFDKAYVNELHGGKVWGAVFN